MTDDEPTNVLYLSYAEGTKELHELRRELDGALQSQRKQIKGLFVCLIVLAIVSVCSVSFCVGLSLR